MTVQRIPVAGVVAKQNRCRLALSCRVADVQPLVESVGPGCRPAEFAPPLPGDRQQPRIERLLQLLDRFRVRRIEIAVLAFAEAITRHIDGATEKLWLVVQLAQLAGLLGSQQSGEE